jgi:hypothetical protein
MKTKSNLSLFFCHAGNKHFSGFFLFYLASSNKKGAAVIQPAAADFSPVASALNRRATKK